MYGLDDVFNILIYLLYIYHKFYVVLFVLFMWL